MANFKVGDEVVCLTNKSERGVGTASDLTPGKTYRVEAFERCGCGAEHVFLVGMTALNCCQVCSRISASFRAWRFIKLDGLNEPEAEFVGTNLPALVE